MQTAKLKFLDLSLLPKNVVASAAYTITPEVAKELLENNTSNRKVRGRVVNAYAEEMLNDNWQLNGEAVQIADSGILMNGQHRLLACCKANKPFSTFVVSGVSGDTVFSTIDTGTKRTASDVFGMEGIKYSTSIASALVPLVRYENWTKKDNPENVSYKCTSEVVPNHVLLERWWAMSIQEQERLKEIVSKTKNYKGNSTSSAAFFYISLKNPDSVMKFFNDIVNQNFMPSSPGRALFRLFASTLGNLRTSTPDNTRRFGAVIRSWNYYAIGKSLNSMRFSVNDKVPNVRNLP